VGEPCRCDPGVVEQMDEARDDGVDLLDDERCIDDLCIERLEGNIDGGLLN
jgi:hypothetical protein